MRKLKKKYNLCLIIPYFGKLPNYFQLWLNSCKYNKTVDFLLYTDDSTEYNYPKNVKVKYMKFDDFKEKIQKNFDFQISLKNAYKLCDYKVAYGEILKDELKKYEFWGHCDLDLIWGDIRKFITDEILDKYDKILTRGHFTLYRNTEKVNCRYKNKTQGVDFYKKVYTSNDIYIFDEWPGIYKIYKENNYKMYEDEVCADISIKYKNLWINSDKKNAIFSWSVEHGVSKIYAYTYNKKIEKKEYMYIHLQKRKMILDNLFDKSKMEYIIIPNKFKSMEQKDIDSKIIKKYTTIKIYRSQYIKMKFKNLKKKIEKKLRL